MPRSVRVSLSPTTLLWIGGSVFGAFFLLAFVRNIPDTLTRVTLGIVFAFALDPIVVRLRRVLRCSRGTAVAMVGCVALALFAVLVLVIGPPAVRQADQFSNELPQTIDQLSTLPVIGDVLERTHAPERIRTWSSNLPARIDNAAISRYVSTLVDGIVAGLTVIVVGVACLSDGEHLVRRMQQILPGRHRSRAIQVGRVFYRTIGAYFAGSLLVATLAATFVLAVGLALDVPLAPMAAIWVLIVNFIPQIGGFLGASMFTLLGLAHSPGTGLLCLVLYLVYMNIENHVLQPLIIGNAIHLSAAATMLAALMGAAAGGVPGAIIATPLVGTIKAIVLELRAGGDLHDGQRLPPTLLDRIKHRAASVVRRA